METTYERIQKCIKATEALIADARRTLADPELSDIRGPVGGTIGDLEKLLDELYARIGERRDTKELPHRVVN